MSAFLHQERHTTDYVNKIKKSLQVEREHHRYYKALAEERRRVIIKYNAERTQTVDVSFYTRSVAETDSTPNQTAIITFARPDFTVAVSHDLKWMLGHYIYIYKKGVFYVEDLMNERYKKRVDILVDKVKDIPSEGVLKNMEVMVLGKELDLYYE